MANSLKRKVLLFMVSILLTVIASAQSLVYYNTNVPADQTQQNQISNLCAGSLAYAYPVVTGAPTGGTYSSERTGGVGPSNGDVGINRTFGVIGAGATDGGNYIKIGRAHV